MQSILIFYQLYQIDAGSISTTCVHFDLKYLLHFLSIFTPNLLHFKNLLRYFTVFYNTFSLKKNVCKPWFQANFSIFPSTLFCCENFFSIISLQYLWTVSGSRQKIFWRNFEFPEERRSSHLQICPWRRLQFPVAIAIPLLSVKYSSSKWEWRRPNIVMITEGLPENDWSEHKTNWKNTRNIKQFM